MDNSTNNPVDKVFLYCHSKRSLNQQRSPFQAISKVFLWRWTPKDANHEGEKAGRGCLRSKSLANGFHRLHRFDSFKSPWLSDRLTTQRFDSRQDVFWEMWAASTKWNRLSINHAYNSHSVGVFWPLVSKHSSNERFDQSHWTIALFIHRWDLISFGSGEIDQWDILSTGDLRRLSWIAWIGGYCLLKKDCMIQSRRRMPVMDLSNLYMFSKNSSQLQRKKVDEDRLLQWVTGTYQFDVPRCN